MRCTTDGGSDAELPLHSRKTEIDIKEGTTNWRSAEIELLQLLSERSRTNFDIVLGWNQVYLKVKVWEIFCPTKISKCTFRITYIYTPGGAIIVIWAGKPSNMSHGFEIRNSLGPARTGGGFVRKSFSVIFSYLGIFALPLLWSSHRVWMATVHDRHGSFWQRSKLAASISRPAWADETSPFLNSRNAALNPVKERKPASSHADLHVVLAS